MKRPLERSTLAAWGLGAAALAGYLLASVAARAETCNLDLKRLDSKQPAGPRDYIYRATYPQRFQRQVGGDDSHRIVFPEAEDQTAAFKKVIKKEPQYQSDHPFRGVARLGSRQYGFALDVVLLKKNAKDAKGADEKKSAAKEKKAATKEKKSAAFGGKSVDKRPRKSGQSESLLEVLVESMLGGPSAPVESSPRSISVAYNRLYFDLNGNGDLTDDKPVEADSHNTYSNFSFSRFAFPRVDMTVDIDGAKLDYSFLVDGYVNVQPEFGYAMVSLNAAAYREGDITLDGQKHHVVLIDFNSNGRFDDEGKIHAEAALGGRLAADSGDVLWVDPDPGKSGFVFPYDWTSGSDRLPVSKRVNIAGKYYDLKISPAGDRLTLTPATVAMGRLSNPSEKFRAVIYGDQGILNIAGTKDEPIPVPVGHWKLYSYTIFRNGYEKAAPEKEAERSEKKDEKRAKLTGKPPKVELIDHASKTSRPALSTIVTAQATAGYKPIEVRPGETAVLPFGPPYTPKVTASMMMPDPKQPMMYLRMSLVGTTGEECSNIVIDGGRPPKPSFTITDPKGKVVEEGSFEYG
jgi:hypothetical protein